MGVSFTLRGLNTQLSLIRKAGAKNYLNYWEKLYG